MQATNITSYSATIEWVTSYLAYTQEQYRLSYGTDMESLDETSLGLSSSPDISASNVTYNIPIRGLIPNTVYYYQLRSENTYDTTLSGVMNFTTLEAGKTTNLIIYIM